MNQIIKHKSRDGLMTIYENSDKSESIAIIKTVNGTDIQNVTYEEGQELIKDYNCSIVTKFDVIDMNVK